MGTSSPVHPPTRMTSSPVHPTAQLCTAPPCSPRPTAQSYAAPPSGAQSYTAKLFSDRHTTPLWTHAAGRKPPHDSMMTSPIVMFSWPHQNVLQSPSKTTLHTQVQRADRSPSPQTLQSAAPAHVAATPRSLEQHAKQKASMLVTPPPTATPSTSLMGSSQSVTSTNSMRSIPSVRTLFGTFSPAFPAPPTYLEREASVSVLPPVALASGMMTPLASGMMSPTKLESVCERSLHTPATVVLGSPQTPIFPLSGSVGFFNTPSVVAHRPFVAARHVRCTATIAAGGGFGSRMTL